MSREARPNEKRWWNNSLLLPISLLFLVNIQEAPSIDGSPRNNNAIQKFIHFIYTCIYIFIYLNKWFQPFEASTVEYTEKLWLVLRVHITNKQRAFDRNETIWTTTAIGVFCPQITSALTQINVIGRPFSTDRSSLSSEFQAYKSRIKQRLYTPEEFLKLRQCTWNLGENN